MKVIIAGSRELWLSEDEMAQAVADSGYQITEVVSGNARGIDRCGETWGYENDIPVKLFPANWDRYGKAAGVMRNQEMADYANALLAIWNGKSAGTRDMIARMRRLGKPVFIVRPGLRLVTA